MLMAEEKDEKPMFLNRQLLMNWPFIEHLHWDYRKRKQK